MTLVTVAETVAIGPVAFEQDSADTPSIADNTTRFIGFTQRLQAIPMVARSKGPRNPQLVPNQR